MPSDRERVPIIAIRDEPAPVFRGTFNAIAAYIDTNYVRAGTIGLPGDQHEGVFVDRRLVPEGVYEPLGFPCFTRKGIMSSGGVNWRSCPARGR